MLAAYLLSNLFPLPQRLALTVFPVEVLRNEQQLSLSHFLLLHFVAGAS